MEVEVEVESERRYPKIECFCVCAWLVCAF